MNIHGRNDNANDNGRPNDGAAAAAAEPAPIPAPILLPRPPRQYMSIMLADGTVRHFADPGPIQGNDQRPIRENGQRPIPGIARVTHNQDEAIQQWGDRYNRLPPGELESRATHQRAMGELEAILRGAPAGPPAAPNDLDDKMAWWINRIFDAEGGPFALRVEEIEELTALAIDALRNDNLYLKLKAPMAISRELLGDLRFLRRVFETGRTYGNGKFLFLGNYVDQGDRQLEVASVVLIMKAWKPGVCFLLRGHHEARTTNGRQDIPSSFSSQCKATFPEGDEGERVWTMFNDDFDYLPVWADLYTANGNRDSFATPFGIPLTVTLTEFERICQEEARPFTVQEGTVFHEITFGAPGFEEY